MGIAIAHACTMVSGGGQLTKGAACLSHDGRQLLVCAAHAVRVYSALTGELLFSLEAHTDFVTGIVLGSAGQAWSASLDGTLTLWDLASRRALERIDLGLPIVAVAVAGASVYASCVHAGGASARLLLYDSARGSLHPRRARLSPPAARLAATSDGTLVAVADSRGVRLVRGGWANFGRSARLRHTREVCAVSLAPDARSVAAGDVSGRLLVWADPDTLLARALEAEDEQKAAQRRELARAKAAHEGADRDERSAVAGAPADVAHPPPPSLAWTSPEPTTTVHWHASALTAVSYAADGSRLLTGGAEAVLVSWDAAAGTRSFLPRLGGPIVGLHPSPADPARVAVRQSDNTLRLVNLASARVEASVHGVRPRPRPLPAVGEPAGPLLVPATGQLLLPGPHGVLQLYDPVRDAHVDRLALEPHAIAAAAASSKRQRGGGDAQRAAAAAAAALIPGMDGLAVGAAATGGSGRGKGGRAEAAVGPATATTSSSRILESLEASTAATGWLAPAPGDEPRAATHLTLVGRGDTLVSVERAAAPGAAGTATTRLKFWDSARRLAEPEGQAGEHAEGRGARAPAYGRPWSLATSVDAPHGRDPKTSFARPVACVAAHPRAELVSTASADGEIKVWCREGAVSGSWRCLSAAHHGDAPAEAMAYSQDGSLLFVAGGGRVVAWRADEPTVARVLVPDQPEAPRLAPGAVPPTARVFDIAHVAGTSLLAIAYGPLGHSLFDLATLTTAARPGAGVWKIEADPETPHYATLALARIGDEEGAKGRAKHEEAPLPNGFAGGDEGPSSPPASPPASPQTAPTPVVLIFRGSDPVPRAAWRARRGALEAVAFAPRGTELRRTARAAGPTADEAASSAQLEASPLLLVTTDREYEIAGTGGRKVTAEGAAASAAREAAEPGSTLRALLGDRATGSAEAIRGAVAPLPSGSALGALAEVPSHALPRMDALAPALLDAMLERVPL